MNFQTANSNGIGNGQLALFEGTLLNRTELASQLNCPPDSDSDILIAAFLKWGTDFPAHLDGSFALALFDMDRNQVILCRDAFGTIPLYTAPVPGGIAFGSRTDDFLARHIVPPIADLQAVWDFLTLGAVPQPRTMLKGIDSLGPGEMLLCNLDGQAPQRFRWWKPEPDDSLANLSFQDTAAAVREHLSDAVRRQVPSLSQKRLLLSGGMDSAVLLSILTAQHGSGIPTLTLGYENRHQSLDETPQAKGLARHFKADARFSTVSDWDVSKLFAKFMKSMDQPSRDGFNMFAAAKTAHDLGADTIITGLGGDELFAGYPHVLRRLNAARTGTRFGWLSPVMRNLPERFRHNIMLPFLSTAESLETIRAQAYESSKRAVVNPDLLDGKAAPRPWLDRCADFCTDSRPLLQILTCFDLELDMEHTLLRDSYLHSRSNLVHATAPMLSPALACGLLGLPEAIRLNGGQPKALLHTAFADAVPDTVRHAPKRGFEMPLLSWLGGPLLTRAREAFGSPQALMLFRRQLCLNWAEKLPALQPRDYPLWSRFILLEWMRQRNITDIQ